MSIGKLLICYFKKLYLVISLTYNKKQLMLHLIGYDISCFIYTVLFRIPCPIASPDILSPFFP